MRIVRRHHPLAGREYAVSWGGKERLRIQLEDGTTMRLPRSWTDADGSCEEGPEEIYTVESLRRLIRLVDAFSRG